MRRYPAYDPPEYLDWQPDAEAMAAWRARLTANAARQALIEGLGPRALRDLYRGLVRARLHDIALKRWVKRGVISKAWLATGEEAATVGCVHGLEVADVVGPMIRNAAACIEKGAPLLAQFSAYLATTDNPTGGRDLHTGSLAHHVLTPISHVAANVPVIAGMALAFKLDGVDRVALCWTGDGATRCGEFHEGVNLAAVQRLPAIFVVQNNHVALGTAVGAHSRAPMAGLAAAYGVPLLEADGNHALDVWAATRQARALAASGEGPALLVVDTFRMGGHATHDEAEARRLFDAERFAAWGKRDPIGCFETWLIEDGPPLDDAQGNPPREGAQGSPPPEVAPTEAARAERNRAILTRIEAEATAEIEAAADAALVWRDRHQPDPATLTQGVFAAPGPDARR